ncbi:tetraspanin Tsp3 [Amylocarpus encephaloides]|uniref:Tetraspanin Tsp3 n=1 Tax=Amylocarpus encephaloides TaxID=45428 RepID=A0A9P7YFW6_9HELO|nr:tetraspanin Tsp3 [Amylocarpus encephaloides]
MTSVVKFFLIGGPLLLIILIAIAGFAYSRILYLNLPIPQSLALFAVVLPIITGISMQGIYGLIQRASQNEQYQITVPFVVVISFQLIYETVVATLALTYIIPPSSLHCGLEDRWAKLFHAKNGEAIRKIQNAFNCCGLHSVKDRAFPFPGQQPSSCAETLHRANSCFGPWRQSEQTQAGLLFLVAILVFVVKAISIINLLTSSNWKRSTIRRIIKRITNSSGNEDEDPEDNRASNRRLIEDNAAEGPYRDNPENSTTVIVEDRGIHDQTPRVLPLTLTENLWRG